MKEYAVWNGRTDEFICMGTAKECAAYLGFKNEDVFRSSYCRCLKPGRHKYEIRKVGRK